MKAIHAVLFIAFSLCTSSALATADAGERDALVAIRSFVPGLDISWSDATLLQVCQPGSTIAHVTCADGHVSELNFARLSVSSPSIGALGNIAGLRFLKSLFLGPYMRVPNLDVWYQQLPSLTSLSFSTNPYSPITPIFSADFAQNPLLMNFKYIDSNTSVFPSSILGAPGLKSLMISLPRIHQFSNDLLEGMNLTSLSFASSGMKSGIREFPDFSHLTYLEALDLSSTLIQELQDNFTGLVSLRTLNLDACRSLTKIPSSVGYCVKLESISCDSCKLNQADSLPDLSSTRLNKLSLSRNEITTWWAGLCQLSANPLAPGLTIDFQFNQVSDPPACFADTTRLYSIAFHRAMLTSFPAFLANISSLSSLTITSSRQMTGGIPDLSRTSLVHLDLRHSGLDGTFASALPTSLSTLHVSDNKLTGTIHDNIFAGLSSLSILDLSYNQLTGDFPSSIGTTNVDTLIANSNAFTSIPSSIGQLPLVKLDFHDNNLVSIPSDDTWDNTATTLIMFYLYNNRHLNAPLPAFWSKSASAVVEVDLSGCSFTGNVPSINSSSLKSLILSDNALNGIIMPSENGHSVGTFKVDRNALTGSLPPSFGVALTGLTTVDVFDVSFNRLTGSIPSTFQSIFDAGHISQFYFNNNGIDGPLPNLTQANRLLVFQGDNTNVRLCETNPHISNPRTRCVLNNVQFPGSCGCEFWYTTCTTDTTCPAPGFVAPVDPPGLAAPTPVLSPSSDPALPPEILPPASLAPEFTAPLPTTHTPYSPPVSNVPIGSAESISTSLAILLLGALFL